MAQLRGRTVFVAAWSSIPSVYVMDQPDFISQLKAILL